MMVLERENEKLFELAKKINNFITVLLLSTLADLVYLIKEFFHKSKESFLEVPSLKD